jgi:protein-S-isoprenylcysteine O-methyltransferase Ste14
MKPVIVAVTLLSSAAWLALAVAGWGGFTGFFSHPALIALAGVTAGLVGTALFTSGNISSGRLEDRSNRWVFIPVTAIGLLSGFVPAYTDRIGLWTLDGDAIRWLGVALFAAGGTLRILPVFVLGRRFSGLVAIQPGHTLVTTGIYGAIRNPSYLGLLVMLLGWALAFRSSLGVLLTILIIPPLIARMSAEERLLRSEFGAEYEEYRARTARLIPHVY